MSKQPKDMTNAELIAELERLRTLVLAKPPDAPAPTPPGAVPHLAQAVQEIQEGARSAAEPRPATSTSRSLLEEVQARARMAEARVAELEARPLVVEVTPEDLIRCTPDYTTPYATVAAWLNTILRERAVVVPELTPRELENLMEANVEIAGLTGAINAMFRALPSK